jgi:hypothetical protein
MVGLVSLVYILGLAFWAYDEYFIVGRRSSRYTSSWLTSSIHGILNID